MSNAWPKDKDELLQLIEKEWKALMEVVDRLTPEQMTRPDAGGWSPKDNLAHLTEWMAYMKASYIQKVPPHEALKIEAEKLKHLDEDGENAILFERNRQRPAADVVARLKSTYADVMETLRSMSYADFMKPIRESGPDKRLVMEGILGNTSAHFHEHRETIEKGLQ